ncbi:CLUMA_CG016958, isoform A [Clunio marinus]|uniref:CLUMA_CG016958, isoform A n=1 Tax=Clunio marinus TaxID=568069 RepID=A0A1J1IVM2_9DIPT|nr:CLUMA_CG016958, isoform A [Clunio marinus]
MAESYLVLRYEVIIFYFIEILKIKLFDVKLLSERFQLLLLPLSVELLAVSIFVLVLSLLSLSDELTIDCQYSVRSHWTVTNVYQCTGRINFIGDPQNITAVTDNHTGRNNSDVLGLVIQNQITGFIPKNIDQFFPNLISLSFIGTGIESLYSSDLKVFPNLTQIDFTNNLIRQLNFHVFDENLALMAINFQSNPLVHIGHGVFDVLNRLVSINTVGTCHSIRTVLFEIPNFYQFCPASFPMIETEILTGENFDKAVDKKISRSLSDFYAEKKDEDDSLIVSEPRK